MMPNKIFKSRFTRDGKHPIPRFINNLIKEYYPSLQKKHFKTASDYVIYRRILNDGSTSIYHFTEWLGRNNLTVPTPLYTWHEVIKTRALGVHDTTYTLAVASESHRFDSEGVISKNTVADLMKYSMVQVAGKLPEGATMLLQIHDELLFEVKKGLEDKVAHAVKEVMGSVADLKVPMIVDNKIGPNWADLQHHPKYA